MKKTIIIIAAIIVAAIISSCTKPSCPSCDEGLSKVTLSLQSYTTRSDIVTTQEEDNKINSVDVFIFHNTAPESPEYQKLDAYKRFTGSELSDLTLTATTGPKTICIIVNEHTGLFKGATDLTAFRKLVSNLKDELVGSFTMYGEKEETLGVTTSVAMTVTRLISKVEVKSIKTKFAGTPYDGMTLSNIKLYLVNAHAQKIIYNNASSPATPLVYNSTKLVGEDANATTEANLIYQPLTGTINDTGLDKQFFFYCYSNETDQTETCTKLVLQADLDGITYYYPILINQDKYGYLPETGYKGIRQNSTYSYSITVTRPGSPDPNIPVVPGTLDLSLSTSDWAVIPTFEKEF